MRGFAKLGPALGLFFLAACNDNSVVGLPGDISVSPSSLDFGRVEENTDFAQTVVVSNVGDRVIEVTSIHVEPPGAAYVLGNEMPTPENPWRLQPRDFRPVDLHFVPPIPGQQEAVLVVESNDPDEQWVEVPLTGRGFHVQHDTFTQGQQIGGAADILFVVDNSGSMSEEQTKLGNSFNTFINWLVGKNVDYRIAVTTTDMVDSNHSGRFQGNPKVLSPQTANVVDAFKANVQVGTSGSATEKGLEGGLKALQEPLISSTNTGFLRPEARLFVVFVTDEEDSSPGTAQSYVDGFKAVKGGDLSKIFFAAIAGPPPYGCFTFSSSADAGTRYKTVVDSTSGLFGSICDNDFGVTLQNLAFEVTASNGDFPLTQVPIPSTIRVTVDGIPQPAGNWVYLPGPNVVHFQPGFEPAPGVMVQITYEVE